MLSKKICVSAFCCLFFLTYALEGPLPQEQLIPPLLYTPILFKRQALERIYYERDTFLSTIIDSIPNEKNIHAYIQALLQQEHLAQPQQFHTYLQVLEKIAHQEKRILQSIIDHANHLLAPTTFSLSALVSYQDIKFPREDIIRIADIIHTAMLQLTALSKDTARLTSPLLYYPYVTSQSPVPDDKKAILEQQLPDQIQQAEEILKRMKAIKGMEQLPVVPPPLAVKHTPEEKSFMKLIGYIPRLKKYFDMLAAFDFDTVIQSQRAIIAQLPADKQLLLTRIAHAFSTLQAHVLSCSERLDDWFNKTVAPLGLSLDSILAQPSLDRVPQTQRAHFITALKRYFKAKKEQYNYIFYMATYSNLFKALVTQNSAQLHRIVRDFAVANMEGVDHSFRVPCVQFELHPLYPQGTSQRRQAPRRPLPPLPSHKEAGPSSPQTIGKLIQDLNALEHEIGTWKKRPSPSESTTPFQPPAVSQEEINTLRQPQEDPTALAALLQQLKTDLLTLKNSL